MSLHDWTIGEATHKFVGLANYTALYHDSRFWNALRVTVAYTVAVSVGQVLLGLAVASRLRKTTWYSALLRSAYFFPYIASLVVVGIVWKFLLDPQVGLVDAWLGDIGINAPDWLQSTALALPTVIAIGIWKNVGFAMIVLLAEHAAGPGVPLRGGHPGRREHVAAVPPRDAARAAPRTAVHRPSSRPSPGCSCSTWCSR